MEFYKYHGLGNDYLVLDPGREAPALTPARIRLICDRNYGAGSDGILYGPEWKDGKPCVRIFNPDGGEAEKSGNGVRIFARYLKDAGYVKEESFVLHTLGGDVGVAYLNADGSLICAHMGKATFRAPEIPVAGPDREVVDEPMTFGGETCRVTCVSVGNPHCVIPLPEISREKACALGPLVENAACFPNRINMQIMKALDDHTIAIEIYERGAGYTLASGSSSCAAACAAHRLGLTGPDVTVRMPGGELAIELRDDGVHMTGKVAAVGTFAPAKQFLDELSLL